MKNSKLVAGYDLQRAINKNSVLEDVGNSISSYRKYKSLSQTELGNLIGIKKSQICKIEKGENLTISTMSRTFAAMGINANLSIEPSIDDKEMPEVVDDLVMTISEFANIHHLAPYQAFRYLDDFGGVEYLLLTKDLQKYDSLNNTIEDLTVLCRRNGGRL